MNCHSAGILGASPVGQKDLMGPRAISGGEERRNSECTAIFSQGYLAPFHPTPEIHSITILN